MMMRSILCLALLGSAAAAAPVATQKAPMVAKKINGHVQLSAEQQKTMHWGCVQACSPSPIESKCATACEAAMYRCIDETGPNETPKDTDKCQAAVLKKYKETKGIEKKEVPKGNATKGNATKGEKKGAKKAAKKMAASFLQVADDEDSEDDADEDLSATEEEADEQESVTESDEADEETEAEAEVQETDDTDSMDDSSSNEDETQEEASATEAEEEEEEVAAESFLQKSKGSDDDETSADEETEGSTEEETSADTDVDADAETSADADEETEASAEDAEQSTDEQATEEGADDAEQSDPEEETSEEDSDESLMQVKSSWKPEPCGELAPGVPCVKLYEHPQGSTFVGPCPVESQSNTEACGAYFGGKADADKCPQLSCPKALGVTMKLTCGGGCCPTCWAPDHVIAVDRHTSIDDAAVVDPAPQAPGSCGGVKCFKLNCAPGYSEGHVNGDCCYSCTPGR